MLRKACRTTPDIWCALEEICHRHLQRVGDFLKPAGAHSIGAFFVFLNLLKRQVEASGEFLLAYAEVLATQPHSTSNILIRRIWRFPRHLACSLANHEIRGATVISPSGPFPRAGGWLRHDQARGRFAMQSMFFAPSTARSRASVGSFISRNLSLAKPTSGARATMVRWMQRYM